VADDTYWITEPSPGGTGQIEAFYTTLAEQPEAFTRALEDALRVSAAETMDGELQDLLRSVEPTIRDALEGLRTSWAHGHGAATAAVNTLDQVVASCGLSLSSAARSVLSTRLAGPGAHPKLLNRVNDWLDRRRQGEELSGLQVSSRALGALVSDDLTADETLYLPAESTRARRARAISNVLWSWGAETQGPVAFNPFAPPMTSSVAELRSHADLTPAAIELSEWTGAARMEVHSALLTHGEILVRVPGGSEDVLRTVVLDLQVHPVEVGSLLCHPVVVGVTTATAGWGTARLLLREAI
jgi:hypothetical protein